MGLLVSLTDYKTWRNVTGTAYDTAFTQVLTMVSSKVREMCGRDQTNGFESSTRTEVYSGTDETTIQLREWPITSITSVTQLYAGGDSTVLDSNTYRVDADTGLLSRIDVWRNRFANVRTDGSMVAGTWKPEPRFADGFLNFSIVYVGGYSTIPGGLQMAVCQLADMAYAAKARDTSVTSKNLGQYSVTYSDPTKAAQLEQSIVQRYNTGST